MYLTQLVNIHLILIFKDETNGLVVIDSYKEICILTYVFIPCLILPTLFRNIEPH